MESTSNDSAEVEESSTEESDPADFSIEQSLPAGVQEKPTDTQEPSEVDEELEEQQPTAPVSTATIEKVVDLCVAPIASFGDQTLGIHQYIRSDAKYLKQLNYFFPNMQPSKITICRDKVTAPPVSQPGSLDSSNIRYKVMSGIQFEVTANHKTIMRPKQLRMHGNTGQYGVEDSCEEFPI